MTGLLGAYTTVSLDTNAAPRAFKADNGRMFLSLTGPDRSAEVCLHATSTETMLRWLRSSYAAVVAIQESAPVPPLEDVLSTHPDAMEPKPVVDLMAALEESLAKAKAAREVGT